MTERGVNPFAAYEWYADKAVPVPDIVEFVLSDQYLNRPNIYPRQLTILKTMFLQTEQFTQFDWDVLEQWAKDFDHTGDHGIQPDIEQRIAMCKAEGRKWFRETVAAIGRRGSKGYTGGIAGAYVLWNYLALGDPQEHYGVDRDKRLTSLVFAGKKEQAKANQWRDLVNVILGSNCFAPYISRPQAESLTVRAPADFRRELERGERGISTDMDLATFEILPKESTAMAGRGPAAFMQHYDEMAHVVATSGAARSAEEVYAAATPALDQFGLDGFIYEGSSPWQRTGQFYANYEMALEREDGRPVYHNMLMLQLTSWDPYEDWARANEIPLAPGRRYFFDLKGPIQSYDDQMRQLERSNPDTFKVERRSKFATVLDAYLDEAKVEAVFSQPWQGEVLTQQSHGRLNRLYKAHADPAKVNDRYGFSIAHAEADPDDPEIKHVVFDVIHNWDPADFEDHTIDYIRVEEELWDFVKRFSPYEMTFDQYNSASSIARLKRKAAKEQALTRSLNVYEKTATAPLNWIRFEVFKSAVNMGWVHAPPHDLAEMELKFLREVRPGKVDHPDTGPVTSKDVADTMVECVYALIGSQVLAMNEALGQMSALPGMQGGMDPYGAVREAAPDGNASDRLSALGAAMSNAGAYGSRARGRRG